MSNVNDEMFKDKKTSNIYTENQDECLKLNFGNNYMFDAKLQYNLREKNISPSIFNLDLFDLKIEELLNHFDYPPLKSLYLNLKRDKSLPSVTGVFANFLLDSLHDECIKYLESNDLKIKKKIVKRRIQIKNVLKLNESVLLKSENDLNFLYFLTDKKPHNSKRKKKCNLIKNKIITKKKFSDHGRTY